MGPPSSLGLRFGSTQYDEQVKIFGNLTVEEEIRLMKDFMDSFLTNVDSLFLIIMGALIILMQAGFGFLEAGAVRAKNTTNILIKNYTDLCFGILTFWLVGYAFAFGEGNPFIGLTHFAAQGLTFGNYGMVFFQSTFAATCATIVSGAIAERCHFNGYIIICSMVTSVAYPIGAHWCWATEGWLHKNGFRDFAGAGVVHLSGGIIALVGAIILGPRIDRFKDKNSTFISGHSIPHSSLGGFILAFGFIAFNAGSKGSISQIGDGEIIGTAAYSTLIGCSSGGATVLFLWKLLPVWGGNWSLGRIINGCLVGMVSICGGCGYYYPGHSIIVSSVAGCIYVLISMVMVKLKIDDPLDAVAVHAGGGFWGLIAAPIFHAQDGLLANGGDDPASIQMLLWNVVGAGVLITFHSTFALILFVTLAKCGLFRVPASAELAGLDILKHNEPAYGFDTFWPDSKRMLGKPKRRFPVQDYMAEPNKSKIPNLHPEILDDISNGPTTKNSETLMNPTSLILSD